MLGGLLRKAGVFDWHFARVSVPRAQRLADAIVALAPPSRDVLDVGCGDGTLGARVGERLGAQVQGVDVKVQPGAAVPVQAYDGRTLPFPDGSFDLVTVSDVLHHADDPLAVLRECLRVLRPGGAVVVKDHFRMGFWSDKVLLAMDVVGNYAQGILVTGRYLSSPEWMQLVADAGGAVDRLTWPFVVHDLPWRWVARSEYQFLMRVRRA